MNLEFAHCDDLAASPGVNEAMLKLLDDGVCHSFSILGNGYGFNDLRDRVDSGQIASDVDFWIHLNLSEGRPAAAPDEVPLLLNSSGQLHWSFIQIARKLAFSTSASRQSLLEQIEIEWRAQMNQVLSLTHRPNIHVVGLDGHQHVHVLPFLVHIARRLQSDSQIDYLRIPSETPYFSKSSDLTTLAWWIGFTKSIVLRTCLLICQSPRDAHRFVGVIYSGRMTMMSARRGVVACKRRGAGSSPILVLFHPCACLPSEAKLWSATSLAKWYRDPWRLIELDEIRLFHEVLTKNQLS